MIKNAGLVEVVIVVRNLDNMVRFYRDALGLAVLYPKNVKNYKNEHSVTLNTGACLMVLKAGGPESKSHTNPKFSFGVHDIDQARSYLTQREIQVGDIRSEGWGHLVCDCYDPEGNIFSLECLEQPSVANLDYARA